MMKFPVQRTCILKYYFVNKRDYSTENINLFKKCIASLSFSEVYETDNANESFNSFYDLFKLFYDLCFPIIKRRMSTVVRPKWITRGIKRCSKKRRTLLWQYRLTRNSESKKAFKTFSKRYQKVIKLTQRAQNSYFIGTSTNKSKATWKVINSMKPNIPKSNIHVINVNGKCITNPKMIAEQFNDYFVDSVQPNVNGFQTNDSVNTSGSHKSMFMEPTIPNDIITIINNLKNTNSTGYDDIDTRVVKAVAPLIAPILSDIINNCIQNGIFPQKLKVSIIKPLHKKDDKTKLNNYRPVALIPIFSKIFEKVIYNDIYNYFEKHKLFCKEQMGFRKTKTINMAIYNFLEKIHHNLDNRKPVMAMYMDMTRAFDYVDHKVLLNKLNRYGIRGNVLSLIQSYLEDRKQITQVSQVDIKSKTEIVYSSRSRVLCYGVPQGSVLGPLLFICYINDFPQVIMHQMSLFADDSTVIYNTGSNKEIEDDINTSLVTIVDWLNSNNLKMNLTKTKIMNFKLRQKSQSHCQINYKGDQILETNVTKFLGLHIDNDMSWRTQIDHVCGKLSKFSYALYMLGKIVNKTALLAAYHGYVASTLRYGLIFWGNATKVEQVLIAQKKCIRAICKIKRTDSCKPHFQTLKILTVPSLYVYEACMFVKNNMFLYKSVESQRRSKKLHPLSTKTKFMYTSIYAMAPKLYNKLPHEIVSSSNMNEFKRRLFELLNDKAYYSVNEYLNDTLK